MSHPVSVVPADFLPPVATADRAQDAMTLAQANFLRSLATEREIDAEAKTAILARLDDKTDPRYPDGLLTKRRASEFIGRLKDRPKAKGQELPNRRAEATDFPKVADGRYALREADGVVRFYKVDCPTEGRWAGRCFLSIQASDELHAIKSLGRKREVLGAIAADPIAALKLYGQELGKCGHCGRTLTDETSRAFGIGPVCRDHLGL